MIKGTEALNQLQAELAVIYQSVNERLTTPDVLNRLDENAGYLAKSTIDGKDSTKWLTGSLAWLIALANKLEIDLQDAVLRKYPGYCHYCLEPHCVCETTLKTPKAKVVRDDDLSGKYLTLANRLRLQNIVPTLDFFVGLLSNLYPANVTRWRLNQYEILAKLAEERAEIVEAYRRHVVTPSPATKAAIAEEIADYFCWLMAVWHLSHRSIDDYSVQIAFTSQYRFGCPYCAKPSCSCAVEVQFGVRSDSQLDHQPVYEPDKLKKLEQEVDKLIELIRSSTKAGIDPAIPQKLESLKNAPTKKDMNATLSEVQSALGSMERGTESVANVALKVKSLMEWIGTYWPS